MDQVPKVCAHCFGFHRHAVQQRHLAEGVRLVGHDGVGHMCARSLVVRRVSASRSLLNQAENNFCMDLCTRTCGPAEESSTWPHARV